MRGFTLLETMVALVIFLLVLAGFTQSMADQNTKSRFSEIRAAAAMAAQFYLDETRAIDPTTLPPVGTGTPVAYNIDGRDFVVTPSFCAKPNWCQGTTARHIQVAVTYQGVPVYTTETIFTQLR
jgi:prepilin-type N-terminal cleavage/methylation domain-containing protein